MSRLLKTSTLMALALFLVSRFYSGVLLYYINQRFVTLTLLASLGLVLLAVSYYRQPQDTHHHDGHDHSDHDHGTLTWVGLLMLMVPVVLGFFVAPKPLGAGAMSNREVSIGGVSSGSLSNTFAPIAPPGGNNSMGVVAGERNIMDWLLAFQQASDPAGFNGQTAQVIGFVYRDERLAADMFMVSRFVVSCCVADGTPVGLIVRWSTAVDIPADQWVEVKGHFEAGAVGEVNTPILVADVVTPIEPPKQPYLYR